MPEHEPTDRLTRARSADARVARPAGLAALLAEAEAAWRHARRRRGADGAAVCAWNHFENIPTFYNWNNRPR